MFSSIGTNITNLRAAFNFRSLPAESKSIVFYSEARASEPHLEPLISELLDRGRRVQLLVSDPADPMIELVGGDMNSHCIGTGFARTWTFSNLEASVIISTTPDLETMQLKRSKSPVFYVYANHSLNSTHMAYRPGAFDHFDAILCTGPQMIEEIRATEKKDRLPRKTLVKNGLCRLDRIIENGAQSSPHHPSNRAGESTTVLIAPTWGETSILATCGEQLIEVLLSNNFNTIVRPHPETTRKSPQLIRELSRRFGKNDRFTLDTNPRSETSIRNSDIMISDWSGVATEYAYGREKPVLFIDLPPKVNNPAYRELGIEPLEAVVRKEIGELVDLEDLPKIPEIIEKLLMLETSKIQEIRKSREERVYNVGTSASISANYIELVADAADYGARQAIHNGTIEL